MQGGKRSRSGLRRGFPTQQMSVWTSQMYKLFCNRSLYASAASAAGNRLKSGFQRHVSCDGELVGGLITDKRAILIPAGKTAAVKRIRIDFVERFIMERFIMERFIVERFIMER